jgi:hypothetical protein
LEVGLPLLTKADGQYPITTRRVLAQASFMNETKWKDYAELIGFVAIIVSLVVLIIEVRQNTLATERQIALDRAASMTSAFFDSELASILEKIKSVDGLDRNIVPFIEAYDLSYPEAVIWERHLQYAWEVLEAEFEADGPSPSLDASILSLLITPDNQLYVTYSGKFRFSDDFRDYLTTLQGRVDEFVEIIRQ